MHNNSKNAFFAVLAFAGLMLLVAALLIGTRPATAVAIYQPESPDVLLGHWNTRVLADNNPNGAYSGWIQFGPDFYTISNDIVATPVRIDGVSYQLKGSSVHLSVGGNNASIEVQLLRDDHATIRFDESGDSTLYMYRQ